MSVGEDPWQCSCHDAIHCGDIGADDVCHPLNVLRVVANREEVEPLEIEAVMDLLARLDNKDPRYTHRGRALADELSEMASGAVVLFWRTLRQAGVEVSE